MNTHSILFLRMKKNCPAFFVYAGQKKRNVELSYLWSSNWYLSTFFQSNDENRNIENIFLNCKFCHKLPMNFEKRIGLLSMNCEFWMDSSKVNGESWWNQFIRKFYLSWSLQFFVNRTHSWSELDDWDIDFFTIHFQENILICTMEYLFWDPIVFILTVFDKLRRISHNHWKLHFCTMIIPIFLLKFFYLQYFFIIGNFL